MNRIIIVGDGFDLAHNLKTKYEDFINWYWSKWLKLLNNSIYQFEEDGLFKIGVKNNSDCLCNYFSSNICQKFSCRYRQENALNTQFFLLKLADTGKKTLYLQCF